MRSATSERLMWWLLARHVETVGVINGGGGTGPGRGRHRDAFALADRVSMHLGVTLRNAREVDDRCHPPQHFLHGDWDSIEIVDQLLPLVLVLDQRAHAAGCGVSGGVVAGEHQQGEE